MNINTVKLIYFSPTRTTKKIVESIAQGIQIDTIEHLDLTPPQAKSQEFEEIHDCLAIIGTPVYSGRVLVDAMHRLQRLKATNTPAVVIVVYGNREYEDALLELRNLATEVGFTPLAGGAFIGEHSYSNKTTPIANGRPDSGDLKKAREFGKMVQEKIGVIHAISEMKTLHVPGNFPYRERIIRSRKSPMTQEQLCKRCRECIEVCPKAAITLENTIITDQNVCILCCACVKICPEGSRTMEDLEILRWP